ncbi:MAG: CDP-alcohol phosphatidyltransferase family protein [Spirochaetaceae bacterium]
MVFLDFFRPWGRFYSRWALGQSAGTVAIGALFLLGVDRVTVATMLLFFYGVSLSLLVLSGRHPVRLCNVVTATRWLLGLSALAWIVGLELFSYSLAGNLRWAIAGLLALAEATDALDGYLARRRGPTSFGAKLDMETDSAFAFILSFVAVAYFGMPGWVLAIGLFHYGYFLLFRFTEEPERSVPAYKGFAKIVCAFLMIGLIVSLAPPISHTAKTTLNAVSLGLLILSFGWDLYLRVAPLQVVRS